MPTAPTDQDIRDALTAIRSGGSLTCEMTDLIATTWCCAVARYVNHLGPEPGHAGNRTSSFRVTAYERVKEADTYDETRGTIKAGQ